MTRYYIGTTEDGERQVFGWDERREPTSEETGYEEIEGPLKQKRRRKKRSSL